LGSVATVRAATNEQDRLIATAKLWGTIKYFHPYLAYRGIDWDKALIDALPAIRSAHSPEEYAKAIGTMLGALHDPATYARAGAVQTQPDTDGAPVAQRTWIHFGLSNSVFASRAAAAGPQTIAISMGDGVNAVVRLSELIPANGEAAIPAPQPDRAYAESRYPSVEYRILAAFKAWIVIRDFFAYRDLMDDDWDTVFASVLPKFIAAKDAQEYNQTVADTITYLFDSQASVQSDELSEFFGSAPVGLTLRLVEKRAVIVDVADPEAAKAGVSPGDIVAAVDGENTIERIKREAKYLSSSTQQSLGALVMARLLNGTEGSTVALTLHTGDPEPKEIRLTRSKAFATTKPQPAAEPIRILSSNIGYVDLTRLAVADVDAMFQKLRGAKAIVFDGRGPTQSLGPALAVHLNRKPDVPVTIVTGPLTITPDLAGNGQLTSTASFFHVEALPEPASEIYAGKTAMLIDERTAGQAELTGLYLEAANNTAFIGTASAGATGQVDSFVLPGGITVAYTRTDIRHGNGGKLQRVGLEPVQVVSPSVAAIRAGRDQPLERAIEYLSR